MMEPTYYNPFVQKDAMAFGYMRLAFCELNTMIREANGGNESRLTAVSTSGDSLLEFLVTIARLPPGTERRCHIASHILDIV